MPVDGLQKLANTVLAATEIPSNAVMLDQVVLTVDSLGIV